MAPVWDPKKLTVLNSPKNVPNNAIVPNSSAESTLVYIGSKNRLVALKITVDRE